MRNKLYSAAVGLLLLLSHSVSAQLVISDSISTLLKTGVNGFQERYHAPSVVLVIVHKDKVIFSDAVGYTDLEKQTPATADSKYQIQSLTKMFTATLAMNLWENGIIRLDDDVRKFVPEYAGLNRTGKSSPATILDLATHSSGLPRNSPADIGFAGQVENWMLTKKNNGVINAASKSDFLHSLGTVTRAYPEYEVMPQDGRQYSNLGYALLGLGLGRAAKDSYENTVINRVIKPLGLNNTGFGSISTPDHMIANGYDYDGKTRQFIRTPDFYANATSPASGIFSTGNDLAKYISAQFSEKNNVVSKKTISMMESLGIGWQRSYPYVKHEGAMLGFRSEIMINPRLDVGWVILTNATDFEFNRFNDYIASFVLPLFAEKPVTDLKQYTGIYALEGTNRNIKVYLENDQLYSTYLEKSLPHEPLTFSGNNTLKAKGSNGREIGYNFLTDRNGKISALNISQLVWVKQ